MSDPAYRITTEHDPTDSELLQWQARIVRLSDGEKIRTSYGATEASALAAAQAYLRSLLAPASAGSVYFANEDGSLDESTPAPEEAERA